MERKRNDLLDIATLTDEQVSGIEAALSSEGDAVLSPAQLIAAVSEASDESLAALLIGSLLQLHQMSRRIGEPAEHLLATRRKRVEASGEEQTEQMLRGMDHLERFATFSVVALTARSIDLSYDCDNILQRSRVLTDVRPIFSDDANDIDGAIVAHTLRIRFDSAGTDKELSLALDPADLRKLILQCERALLKEQTARKQMIEKADILTTPYEDFSDAK